MKVQACHALPRVDEAGEDDKILLASYAKQAQDDGLRKMADRIQARAIRRCGELLQQIQTSIGARTDLEPQDGAVPKLTRTQAAHDAGLSERQRKTAIRVSRIPDPEFEAAVEAAEPPTVTALAERGTAHRGENVTDSNASRSQLAADDPVAEIAAVAERIRPVLQEMTPEDRDRLRSILDGLLSEVRYAAMPAEEAARKRSQAARTQRSRGKNTASKSEVLAATV